MNVGDSELERLLGVSIVITGMEKKLDMVTKTDMRGFKLVARYAVTFAQVMRGSDPFNSVPELDRELSAHSRVGRTVRRTEDSRREVIVYEVFEREGNSRGE